MFQRITSTNLLVLVGALAVTAMSPAKGQVRSGREPGEIRQDESGTACTTVADITEGTCSVVGTDRSSVPEISWVPVDASASFTTDIPNDAGVDTRIILPVDASARIVEFEVRASGWGSVPGPPTLGDYQATLDAAGLSGSEPTNVLNGTVPGVDLTPLLNQPWKTNPGGNGLNDGAFIATRTCHDFTLADTGLVCASIPTTITWETCPAGSPLCLARDDYVFAVNLAVGGVSTDSQNILWGGVANTGQCTADDGVSSYYLGTLVLNVPGGALGTYSFGFDPSPPRTSLDDCSTGIVPGLVRTPGHVMLIVDCNLNGISDDSDIAGCTGDPACDDCNGNAIPDECDIAAGTSDDCNGNRVPDKCEIDPSAGAPGGPYFCTVDCDPDCNLNGNPDSCDIAGCDTAVDLSCDDCNLNGIPDGCDDPVDNLPDTCVEAAPGLNWSDDIWGLNGEFPDDVTGVPGLNITLAGVTLALDAPVEVPTLRLINGAGLDMTLGQDLTIVDEGGMLVLGSDGPLRAGNSTLQMGDTETLTATNLIVRGGDLDKGDILVGSGSVINLSGTLKVDGGGIYRQSVAGSSASLTADTVTLSGGACCSGVFGTGVIGGGEILLFDGMTLTTIKDVATGKTGDFTIKGSDVAACAGTCSGRRGILPPPKLGTGCSAGRSLRAIPGLFIGGNLFISGAAQISIGATQCGLSRSPSHNQIVQLQGDLINQSTIPDFFDWQLGGIGLNGGSPQRFEVAGEDFGALPEGFSPPGTVGSNFSMGTVEVAPGGNVTFVDDFDNDGSGEGLGPEALYVRNLILGSGAQVTIDRCLIYYEQLTPNNVTVLEIFPGKLVQIGLAAAPLTAAYPHDRRKNRYISFDPNKTENDGANVAFKVELKQITLGSCDGNGGFCRSDRGVDDCNACNIDGNACISGAIDCSPGQTCDPTSEICVNDAPDTGGSNVGQTWWVGPESPLANGVHLLVSGSFRRISGDWPNPTHVADCEIVPETAYGIRAVNTDSTAESGELLVETTQFASISSSWWADVVGPLRKFCGGDIRTPECIDDGDCTAPEACDRAWTLPDGSVNFDDVNAALALVAPGPTSVAPDPTWVDLHGNATGTAGSQNFDPPNFVLNFSDIGQILSGFGGLPYKGYDPADCPDSGTWP